MVRLFTWVSKFKISQFIYFLVVVGLTGFIFVAEKIEGYFIKSLTMLGMNSCGEEIEKEGKRTGFDPNALYGYMKFSNIKI